LLPNGWSLGGYRVASILILDVDDVLYEDGTGKDESRYCVTRAKT
jgi:hypothetical protein